MPKDRVYHEDAVLYNEKIASAAEEALEVLRDPTIIKWVGGIARQHRFHEKRHKVALDKINSREATEVIVEQIPEGLDVPEPEDESHVQVDGTDNELVGTALEVEETNAILADPDTMAAIAEAEAELLPPVVVEEDFESSPTTATFSSDPTQYDDDGCVVNNHVPLSPTCKFNPDRGVAANG